MFTNSDMMTHDTASTHAIMVSVKRNINNQCLNITDSRGKNAAFDHLYAL